MSTAESSSTNSPILRNGMDFEPKKTYPPDYSNVPDVRSWQMSPFSKERMDLNDLQTVEKKGIKFRAEYEALKKKYGYETDEEPPSDSTSNAPPLSCVLKKETDFRKYFGSKRCQILGEASYIPYGPTPRISTYPASVHNSGLSGASNVADACGYIPFGPTYNALPSSDYEPMGPALQL